ncbi:MAG TPA: FAD-dependent oxidoreductase, partial [Candidatus Obscuribacter sp.]|nr:FAD-dependent oxidoreductase [Candidatus Obscuribacter sp.]
MNQSKYESYEVIIIGAGGAGLMCAIEAGKRGRRVLIIDHNREVGRKILISGGGRCNFTNLGANPDCYVSSNKHFVKSALSRYTPQDFIKLVQKHHIRYHEKKLGQLFCDESASQIVDMLVKECRQAGVA